MTAAAALIEHGCAGVTHQRVAQRAGLHFAADATNEAPGLRPDEGSLRQWPHSELGYVGELLAQIVQHLIATLIDDDGWDATVPLPDPLGRNANDELASRLCEAMESGELAEQPDAEDLATPLLVPVLFRALLQARPVDDIVICPVLSQALAPVCTVGT